MAKYIYLHLELLLVQKPPYNMLLYEKRVNVNETALANLFTFTRRTYEYHAAIYMNIVDANVMFQYCSLLYVTRANSIISLYPYLVTFYVFCIHHKRSTTTKYTQHLHTHISRFPYYYNQYIERYILILSTFFFCSINRIVSNSRGWTFPLWFPIRRQRNIAITSLCIKVPLLQFNPIGLPVYYIRSISNQHCYIHLYGCKIQLRLLFMLLLFDVKSKGIDKLFRKKKSNQQRYFSVRCSEISLRSVFVELTCFLKAFSHSY